ncbi:MAG: hypothetical protein IT258_14225 [Saprospiraceae bacterium]|nr:hypothetical protein [Saprospiraceae bacterium]
MKNAFFVLITILALAACKDEKTSQPAATNTPPPAQPAATLPSVPIEVVKQLWDEGTQVDYIFYDYPFTMSLSEKPAIQNAVRHISESPAPLKPECKPLGRVTYQAKGEIVLEGEFFFSQGCTYFVFEKNRTKTYANFMTEEAGQYFNAQIQQALKMQQQVQQQTGGGAAQ